MINLVRYNMYNITGYSELIRTIKLVCAAFAAFVPNKLERDPCNPLSSLIPLHLVYVRVVMATTCYCMLYTGIHVS